MEADAQIEESFTRVVITVGSGDVTVQQTTGPSEWFASASFSGDKPPFEPKVIEGVLIVSDGCDPSSDCSALYTINVPKSSEVTASSGSGDITIVGIEAPVDVHTDSGTVFLNTVLGEIHVHTNSGNIVGTRLEASSATFIATSGNIDVSFENVIANLTVETDTGNVTAQLAEGPYNLNTDADSGSTDIKINDDDTAPNMVSLSTGSGDLTVYRQ